MFTDTCSESILFLLLLLILLTLLVSPLPTGKSFSDREEVGKQILFRSQGLILPFPLQESVLVGRINPGGSPGQDNKQLVGVTMKDQSLGGYLPVV